MDTEGYEYNIIQGMKNTLEARKPLRLFIEFHFRFLGKEKCMALLRTLKEHGFEIDVATYEVDENCITHNTVLENCAAYLNSRLDDLPLKGPLSLSIDDILSNTVMWNNQEGAFDFCLRLGTLELMFKRTIPSQAVN